MTPSENKNFCFCTATFGHIYRTLARELAKDLQQYAPETKFIVFTDKPADFQEFPNVLAVKHHRHDVLVYHERRFAIAKALEQFNSCIYLDGDVRICSPVSPELTFQPGIAAKSCYSFQKHYKGVIAGNHTKAFHLRNWQIAQKMAQKVGVDLSDENVKFINEFLFVVTRDHGKEQEFLKLWDHFATYAALHGCHKGPGNAMGIAAAKVGFPVYKDELEGIDFFDDRVERWKIKRGQADPNAKKAYFELQNRLENPQLKLPKRAIRWINKQAEFYYHSLRFRLQTWIRGYNG